MNKELASTFYKNWIKEPKKKVRILSFGNDEFSKQLYDLGCEVEDHLDEEGYSNDFLVSSGRYYENEYDFLYTANLLKVGGVFFYRVLEKEMPLESMLKLLDAGPPTYTIAETYLIGEHRDYLLRKIEKPTRVCIGMIAKNEERDLPKCLASLVGVADGLCLIDTGSTDRTMDIALEWIAEQQKTNPDFWGHVEQYLGASKQDEQGDWKLWNFADARNTYIRRIENAKCNTFDRILWMDADDVVTHPIPLRRLKYLDQYVIQSVAINSGGSKWPHHRLWKTKSGVKYSGWCHEYPGWNGHSTHWDKIEIFHDAAPGAGENSNARNLRILQKQMEVEPTARTAFYLGNTHKDAGRWLEAIEPYKKRLSFGKGYEEEYWFATFYLARCQRNAKLYEDARKTLMTALADKPDWSELWMELAYIESALGDHQRAIGWCFQAMDRVPPPTSLWREFDKYQDQPYRTVSWSYQYLKDYEQALIWAVIAASKIGKPDAEWNKRTNTLVQLVKLQEDPAPTETEAPTTDKDKSIVLTRPGAMGDILMTLNLIPELKRKTGKEIIYRAHHSIVKHLKPLMLKAGIDRVLTLEEEIDPSIELGPTNLIGYPLSEGYPKVPMKDHLLNYFGREMGIEDGISHSLTLPLPNRLLSGQYVTVHVKAGWSMYKEWSLEKWEAVCADIQAHGIPVVQLGGPDDPVLKNSFINLIGESFEKNISALARATMHLGIDSWTNHATNFIWEGRGKVPAVILWGSTQSSAAGYAKNKNISLGLPCQPCFKEDPRISGQSNGICQNPPDQTYEKPKHSCMGLISVEQVLGAFWEEWQVAETEWKNL